MIVSVSLGVTTEEVETNSHSSGRSALQILGVERIEREGEICCISRQAHIAQNSHSFLIPPPNFGKDSREDDSQEYLWQDGEPLVPNDQATFDVTDSYQTSESSKGD